MPTHTDAISIVYARSLYDLAREAGGEEKILEVADELEQICELMRDKRGRFREFMASPIIDEGRRANSLRSIFSDRVTDLTLRFLLVLNDKKRLGHLEAITAAFDHLVHETLDRVEVDLYTPSLLGDEQVDIIRRRVHEALGREPVLHTYAEPAMLGGLKLRIGDQLIDGSVATRLRRLRSTILASGGHIFRGNIDGFLVEEDA
jgi:F-type H+-transporting ATPase subunit delta